MTAQGSGVYRRQEVAAWAHSGIVPLTGHPEGPPLIPPGSGALRAEQLASVFAAHTGVTVDGARLLSERAAYTGRSRGGPVSVGGSCRLLPTADGWAAVSCARPDDPALLAALAFAGDGERPEAAVARWLAAHDGAALAERAELLGVAAGPVTRPRSPRVPVPGLPRSVRGLHIVDFSALWAGPLCAHLLGLAGARVTKVETPGRPDGARRGHRDFFELLHLGHRSVVTDPDTPEGRNKLASLVASADVVIEASRPRALARFGLDAESFVSAGGTWISITSHGREHNRVGFGDDVAASAGLVARDGEGQPVFCGDALADPLTGLTAAVLATTLPDPGRGVLWDVSMTDVVAATLPAEGAGQAPAARPGADGWLLDTPDGPLPVAVPERRR
ncbi:CoA transferase [Streptomyces sp. NPDC091292]|uniref:CoA transferase n=1 Tax=Streptomyces sp. NPDC091292 TaxID=3365991 RepID=UPI003825726C